MEHYFWVFPDASISNDTDYFTKFGVNHLAPSNSYMGGGGGWTCYDFVGSLVTICN